MLGQHPGLAGAGTSLLRAEEACAGSNPSRPPSCAQQEEAAVFTVGSALVSCPQVAFGKIGGRCPRAHV